MAKVTLKNVEIKGIKTIMPSDYIDIDDELEYFENNLKKLSRAKKMIGYGRRYISQEGDSVIDYAVKASEELFKKINFDKSKIDLLIFVNQNPAYHCPSDAEIAHGRLGLNKECAVFHISKGCTGYVHGLLNAMSLMQSGNFKNCLLLAGDLSSLYSKTNNRKMSQVFGDSASATILEYNPGAKESYFVLGTDGTGWEKIVTPFGGTVLPFKKEDFDIEVYDKNNNPWTCSQSLMKGEEVFDFSIDIAPKLIKDTLNYSSKTIDDVDFFAIHQANKQIVDTIAFKAEIPENKYTTQTFTKYANTSTNSVVTVLCDCLCNKKVKDVLLCTFGNGLSWGGYC